MCKRIVESADVDLSRASGKTRTVRKRAGGPQLPMLLKATTQELQEQLPLR